MTRCGWRLAGGGENACDIESDSVGRLKFYLLYREYGLQETILIVVGLVFCVWLFERVGTTRTNVHFVDKSAPPLQKPSQSVCAFG